MVKEFRDSGTMLLSVSSLKKSIRGRGVVKDISFDVRKGEIVGLMGPNGAGKSTSFYLTVGLLRADGGRITLDGVDITNLPLYRRARLGLVYLPQESSIFQGLDVYDNIMAALEIVEPDQSVREERLAEILSQFSLEHIARTPALALSGGERRRVEIARCLAVKPQFLLLDEPFAGIDPIAVAGLQRLLVTLKAQGIGILITEHNVKEALMIIDRGYVIYEGSVLVSGSAQDIIANEDVQRFYLGRPFNAGEMVAG